MALKARLAAEIDPATDSLRFLPRRQLEASGRTCRGEAGIGSGWSAGDVIDACANRKRPRYARRVRAPGIPSGYREDLLFRIVPIERQRQVRAFVSLCPYFP